MFRSLVSCSTSHACLYTGPSRSTRPSVLYTNLLVGRIVLHMKRSSPGLDEVAVFRGLNSNRGTACLCSNHTGTDVREEIVALPVFLRFVEDMVQWFRIVVVIVHVFTSYFHPPLLYVDTDSTSCL